MNIKKPRRNFFIIDREKHIRCNSLNIKKIVNILNKDRLVVVSGLKNIGKVNFIKEFIHKTNSNNSYFYFNKSDDLEDNINNSEDLINLLNEYIQLYKKPTIIILQNIDKIDGIKDFITEIYKSNYKIILVGNTIKIGGIKEIEILSKADTSNENIENTLTYGSINQTKQVGSKELKEKLLQLMVSDIFLNDIFKNFGVKSINLYKFTMTFLVKNNIFLSLRELQKNLDSIKKISLKTTIDYIDFSLQVKILKRVYKYDIKNNKTITSKAKYYFTDNGIRNSLADFSLDKNILIENLIFNKLEYNNYTIYSGLNGKFEFTFYGERENEKIYIHISEYNTKEEIKKEVNKLLKLGEDGRKLLLVDSIEKLGIKKIRFDSVDIVEIKEFLEKF